MDVPGEHFARHLLTVIQQHPRRSALARLEPVQQIRAVGMAAEALEVHALALHLEDALLQFDRPRAVQHAMTKRAWQLVAREDDRVSILGDE